MNKINWKKIYIIQSVKISVTLTTAKHSLMILIYVKINFP